MRVIRLGQTSAQAADKFEAALDKLTNLIETRVIGAFKTLSEKLELGGEGFISGTLSNLMGYYGARRLSAHGQIQDFIYNEATQLPWWSLRFSSAISAHLGPAGLRGYEETVDKILISAMNQHGGDILNRIGVKKSDFVSAHHSLIAGGKPSKEVVRAMLELRRKQRLEAADNLAIGIRRQTGHQIDVSELKEQINQHMDDLIARTMAGYTIGGRIVGALRSVASLGNIAGILAGTAVGAIHGQALRDARTREMLAIGESRIMGIAQLSGASPLELAKGISAAEQSMSGSLASMLMLSRIGPWLGNAFDSRNAGQYAIEAAKAIMGDPTIPRETKRRAMAEIGMTEAMAQIEALGMGRWESMIEKAAAGSSNVSRFGIYYNYAKTAVLDWLAGIGNKLLGGDNETPEVIRENTAAIRRLTDVMMTGQRQAFGSGRHPYEPVPTQWLLYSANMANLMTQASRLSSI